MDTLPETPEALLAQADSLRDRRRWAEAEQAYRAYLAERPHHAEIHVQLGHAVKEQGDAEGALGHYRRAAALAPDSFDPPLMMSHALRLLGRGKAAAAAIAQAVALVPLDPVVRRAAAVLRHRLEPPEDAPCTAPAPSPTGPPTQFAFDITDLLEYLREARTPTGIQRVQMGLLGAILAKPGEAPLLVAYDPGTWRWWHVEDAVFRRVLALARIGSSAADPAWRAATAQLCAAEHRPDAPIRPGATLTTLGNAWGVEDYFRGLRLLRARVPLRYVSFVHDCVPLAMPEHCLELTVRLYARWFAALSLHADAVLANSHATARDFCQFAAPLGRIPPVTVVPLAAQGLGPPAALAVALEAAEALPAPLPGEDFVLFLATLESRKNHLMVFRAWLTLLRRLGAAAPRLVCVGKPGWRAEAALALLDASPDLRRKVSILSDVSDLALAGLTARCLFTVYNSFHEGWGLPVSESLAAGKLCVVPAHSALLESGAPGAVFFPPQDEPALAEALHRLVTDPAHRSALEARIDRAAAARSWQDAAAEVSASLARPLPPIEAGAFPLGRRLALGTAGHVTPGKDGAWAERVRDGLAWWWAEPWGCWARDGVAALRLPTSAAPGTPLRVVLELRGPPGGLLLRLRLRGATPGPWRRLTLAENQRVTCVLQGEAAPDGLLVELDSGDGVALRDRAGRTVGVGVVAVMTCREEDIAARLAMLESAAP